MDVTDDVAPVVQGSFPARAGSETKRYRISYLSHGEIEDGLHLMPNTFVSEEILESIYIE